MITPKQQTRKKKDGGESESSPVPAKTEFRIYGEEMIEKKVKTSGKTGRVYLPGDWVGKQVKIVRID
jgi:putative transposon-encoded protein